MKKSLLFIPSLMFLLCGCAVSYDHAGEQASQSWAQWKNKEIRFRSDKKMTQAQNEKKLHYFLQCVKKFAPYMLEEFRSIDRSMNWRSGTAAKLCCFGVDYKQTAPPHECTSWIIMPELTAEGQVILHKNRDSSARYPTAERVSVPGKYSWIGNCNFGSFGTTSGINEKAVAIAMNSGPRSTGVSHFGMGTTIIARILLEQSGSAEEALELLKEIVDAKAYAHGNSGSIWFIADREQAFVVEHDGLFFKAAEIKSGLAVRANAWHFPEMIIHSKNTPPQIVGNSRREYAVRHLLVNNILGKKKKITIPDVIKASRIKDPNGYALCEKTTITGTTFVIDREFPEELSYFVSSFAPPRHSLYIPVPLKLKEFPIEFRNGSWNEKPFKLKSAEKQLNLKDLKFVESRMLKNHLAASAEARKILRSNVCNAEARACELLDKAFKDNVRIAEQAKKNHK